MPHKIAIIGAGITGLVAGILLKEAGMDVRIFEQKSHIQPLGGGLGLWPNGTQILLHLPCGNAIQQLGYPLMHEDLGDAAGNTLAHVPRDLFAAVNPHPILNLSRHELLQLLVQTFGEHDIYLQHTCINLEQNDTSATVYFDNGTNFQADLVIGADGIFSSTREWLFPHATVNYTGYIALIGLLKFSSAQKFKHHFIWGQNRFLLCLPISQDRYILYAVRPFAQNALKPAGFSQTQQIALFRHWSAEVDWVLDEFEESIATPEFSSHFYCNETYEVASLNEWHKKRTVLIGDAAHGMGSIFAFAANLGLEDAYLLTQCLSDKNIADALPAFTSARIPRVAEFYKLEEERKQLLLNATVEEHENFIRDMQSKHEEIMQPLLNLLSF